MYEILNTYVPMGMFWFLLFEHVGLQYEDPCRLTRLPEYVELQYEDFSTLQGYLNMLDFNTKIIVALQGYLKYYIL